MQGATAEQREAHHPVHDGLAIASPSYIDMTVGCAEQREAHHSRLMRFAIAQHILQIQSI